MHALSTEFPKVSGRVCPHRISSFPHKKDKLIHIIRIVIHFLLQLKGFRMLIIFVQKTAFGAIYCLFAAAKC